jgi:hypothetical protein
MKIGVMPMMTRREAMIPILRLTACSCLGLSASTMTGCSPSDGHDPKADDPEIVKARAARTKRLSDPYMDGPAGGNKARKKQRPKTQ